MTLQASTRCSLSGHEWIKHDRRCESSNQKTEMGRIPAPQTTIDSATSLNSALLLVWWFWIWDLPLQAYHKSWLPIYNFGLCSHRSKLWTLICTKHCLVRNHTMQWGRISGMLHAIFWQPFHIVQECTRNGIKFDQIWIARCNLPWTCNCKPDWQATESAACAAWFNWGPIVPYVCLSVVSP